MPSPPSDRLISLAEAAAILRVSVTTAKKLARRDALPGLVGKVGCQWRVNEAALRAFAEGRQA